MTYDQEYKARNHGEEIDALLSERDSMTPRPDDEMDLTQNNKPFGLLHPDSQAALEEWPHGVEIYKSDGEWRDQMRPDRLHHLTYRAIPEPAPNLIERERKKAPTTDIEHQLRFALEAANALIATMSGGDAYLRARYEGAIK